MTTYRVFYHRTMRVAHDAPAAVSREQYQDIGSVEAEDLEALFRDMNAVDGTETCCKMRVRSMSVGDLAIDPEGVAHYCAGSGWGVVGLVP